MLFQNQQVVEWKLAVCVTGKYLGRQNHDNRLELRFDSRSRNDRQILKKLKSLQCGFVRARRAQLPHQSR